MTLASKGRGGKPAKSRFSIAGFFPVRPESRLFLVFVLLMIGLVTGTALASYNSELDFKSQPGATTPPLQTHVTGAPDQTAAGMFTEPEVPTDNTTPPSDESDQSNTAPAIPACDQGKKQQAMDDRSHSTSQEKTEHDKQVSFIETTGIVTRLVSPGTYSTQMDNENIRHNRRVDEIQQIFLQAMHDAHCDQ